MGPLYLVEPFRLKTYVSREKVGVCATFVDPLQEENELPEHDVHPVTHGVCEVGCGTKYKVVCSRVASPELIPI